MYRLEHEPESEPVRIVAELERPDALVHLEALGISARRARETLDSADKWGYTTADLTGPDEPGVYIERIAPALCVRMKADTPGDRVPIRTLRIYRGSPRTVIAGIVHDTAVTWPDVAAMIENFARGVWDVANLIGPSGPIRLERLEKRP